MTRGKKRHTQRKRVFRIRRSDIHFGARIIGTAALVTRVVLDLIRH